MYMKSNYEKPEVQVVFLVPESFLMQSNESFDPTPDPGEWGSSIFNSPDVL